MNAREAATALRRLLAEERAAIARMDSAAVARAADDKVRLFSALAARVDDEKHVVSEELASLLPELRRNGVLLAHARDCVQGAIAAAHGQLPVAGAGRAAGVLRPGLRVSTRG